jgi:L-iditol 2-dehydrogenase
LPGGFAEYVLVPQALVERGAYLLPAEIDDETATLIEPLACAVRAQRLASVQEGQTVLILGCGVSGLLHVRLARLQGCKVIGTDIDPFRLEAAAKMGADVTIEAAADATDRLIAACGGRADVVVLCTSAQAAVAQAWECVDRGGAVVFFAVPGPEERVTLPVNRFWTQEIRILTSYYCGPPDITAAMELLERGAVAASALITHRVPLAETARGFALVMAPRDSLKVVVKPHEA